WRDRLVRAALAAVLPYPPRFATALAASRLIRPVAALLTARARRVLRLLPEGGKGTRTPLAGRDGARASRDTPAGPAKRQGGTPAAGQDSENEALWSGEPPTPPRAAPLRVALLDGCVQPVLAPRINAAAE